MMTLVFEGKGRIEFEKIIFRSDVDNAVMFSGDNLDEFIQNAFKFLKLAFPNRVFFITYEENKSDFTFFVHENIKK